MQAQHGPAYPMDSMMRFELMEGEWEGVAYHNNREGGVDTIYQHEFVQFNLNGTILNVEGTGRDGAGNLVFNAFATIFYDQVGAAYSMYAFRDNGQSTKADVAFTGPTAFSWSFSPNPYAHIKYEATVTETTWQENGFYSRDGSNWTPIFNMTLNRVMK